MKKLLFISLALVLAFVPANLDARKVKFKNGDAYDGEWKNKAPNGMGVMIYANGEIYSGYWVNGIREGIGTMIFQNGDEYLGNWKEDKFSGDGKMTYANKDFYEGGWEEGKQHGEGTMTYTAGGSYKGGWASGLYEGKGVRVFPNEDIYDGEWAAGQQQGTGTMTYAAGGSYEGSWSAGKPDGEGTMNYAGGDVFSGRWAAGKRAGAGELYDKQHDRYLQGTWNDTELSGTGYVRFAKDQIETLAIQGEWQGEVFSTSYTMGGKTFTGIVLPMTGDGQTGPCLQSGKVEWENGTVADGKWKDNITLADCAYTDMVNGKVRYSVGGRSFDGDIKDGKENNGTLTVAIPGQFSFSGELKAGEPYGIYVGNLMACPFGAFDLSAWDEVQGADIGRIEGNAIGGVFKKDGFTFRGLLKNGLPDGETVMEYSPADSLSLSSSWKDGKLITGRGLIDSVPFTLTVSEDSNAAQVDLENGERCNFIMGNPLTVLSDIKAKIAEQRAIREKLAAQMMAATQATAEPVAVPAETPSDTPAAPAE